MSIVPLRCSHFHHDMPSQIICNWIRLLIEARFLSANTRLRRSRQHNNAHSMTRLRFTPPRRPQPPDWPIVRNTISAPCLPWLMALIDHRQKIWSRYLFQNIPLFVAVGHAAGTILFLQTIIRTKHHQREPSIKPPPNGQQIYHTSLSLSLSPT